MAEASFATEVKAPPMPTARAPIFIERNLAAVVPDLSTENTWEKKIIRRISLDIFMVYLIIANFPTCSPSSGESTW